MIGLGSDKKMQNTTGRKMWCGKFFLQIDFSNLPKWEEETSPDGRGALFQGLEAWEIDVFSLPQLFFGKFTHSRFRKCSHTGSPTHFQQQVGWGTRLYLTNMWGVSALKYFLFVLNKDFKRLWRAHNFTEKSLWCSRSRSDVTIIQYWAKKNNLGLR